MLNAEYLKLNYKKILLWFFLAIGVVGGGAFLVLKFSGQKSLELIWPKGKEELRAGQFYSIRWKSRRIGKIGILLIKDKEPKEAEWLLKDFPAKKQKYDWQVFVWQEPRQDYKIAIFEYPWQEGNKIVYSNNFTILGPRFASCDSLSIKAEWPYLPSDFPNLKKVFITEESYDGNLGGLEGADKKCQEEAERKGWEGNWKAFLGDDITLATERLNLEGIFVEAEGIAGLSQEKVPAHLWEGFVQFLENNRFPEKKEAIKSASELLGKYFPEFLKKYEGQEEKTCHRLLGRNFEEFFKKFSDPLDINLEKFDKEFLENSLNLWLGRINSESKKECTTILTKDSFFDPSLNYSFTTTCQNWTINRGKIISYETKPGEATKLPTCYTPGGKRINPLALAGLSSGIIKKDQTEFLNPYLGKTCDLRQKLLCLQQ